MNDETLQNLIEFREKISNLKAVKCCISHERVKIDNKTKLPVLQSFPEDAYERLGFCRREIRDQRINCAHSAAHIILNDALRFMESEGVKTHNLLADLNEQMNEIYLLDHKKGDAEKQLAVIIEKNHNEPNEFNENDLTEAKNAITEIEKKHGERVERIGQIRELVLTEIQTAISGEMLSK